MKTILSRRPRRVNWQPVSRPHVATRRQADIYELQQQIRAAAEARSGTHSSKVGRLLIEASVFFPAEAPEIALYLAAADQELRAVVKGGAA